MRSYSETMVFRANALAAFGDATRLVESIPPYDAYFDDVRPCELARAIGLVLGLEYVDGTYGAIPHTWLVVDDGTPAGACILDVYTVGALPMVRMLDRFPALPHRSLYTPGAPREVVDDFMVEALISIFQAVPLAATG